MHTPAYEQYDRNGTPIRCANGSDAVPCYHRPEFTLRTSDRANGQWLGTICGHCAADLIDQGKAHRSQHSPFRIVLREESEVQS